MHLPKKYLHDRLILLILSINTFLTLVAVISILLRLDSGRASGYIVSYRSNLGISAFATGRTTDLIAFVLFAVAVLILCTLLSIRAYHMRRQFALSILGMGSLLALLTTIVSNALLVLR